MLRFLKRLVIIAIVFITGTLIYATTRPDAMHVERQITMKAPPEKIFPYINDFHSWSVWSPYEKLDPAMSRQYSGSPSGKGAVYEWTGNSDVGQGRMEITDTAEPTRISVKLDFIKPFEGHNVATFTLMPSGESTSVIWAMDGPSPYVAKVMGIFVDMDNMIGNDFATGLASLKTVVEK